MIQRKPSQRKRKHLAKLDVHLDVLTTFKAIVPILKRIEYPDWRQNTIVYSKEHLRVRPPYPARLCRENHDRMYCKWRPFRRGNPRDQGAPHVDSVLSILKKRHSEGFQRITIN